jgi:hypothetical protein
MKNAWRSLYAGGVSAGLTQQDGGHHVTGGVTGLRLLVRCVIDSVNAPEPAMKFAGSNKSDARIVLDFVCL